MLAGVIVAESLRVGASLADLRLVVDGIRRVAPEHTTADQPRVWTLLDFQVSAAGSVPLADALAGALGEPGWYADFRSSAETFVVFSGRVFRYRRGDHAGRAAAIAHGRSLGVPDWQLDWPV